METRIAGTIFLVAAARRWIGIGLVALRAELDDLNLNPYQARRGGAPDTYTSPNNQRLRCARAAACKPRII